VSGARKVKLALATTVVLASAAGSAAWAELEVSPPGPHELACTDPNNNPTLALTVTNGSTRDIYYFNSCGGSGYLGFAIDDPETAIQAGQDAVLAISFEQGGYFPSATCDIVAVDECYDAQLVTTVTQDGCIETDDSLGIDVRYTSPERAVAGVPAVHTLWITNYKTSTQTVTLTLPPLSNFTFTDAAQCSSAEACEVTVASGATVPVEVTFDAAVGSAYAYVQASAGGTTYYGYATGYARGVVGMKKGAATSVAVVEASSGGSSTRTFPFIGNGDYLPALSLSHLEGPENALRVSIPGTSCESATDRCENLSLSVYQQLLSLECDLPPGEAVARYQLQLEWSAECGDAAFEVYELTCSAAYADYSPTATTRDVAFCASQPMDLRLATIEIDASRTNLLPLRLGELEATGDVEIFATSPIATEGELRVDAGGQASVAFAYTGADGGGGALSWNVLNASESPEPVAVAIEGHIFGDGLHAIDDAIEFSETQVGNYRLAQTALKACGPQRVTGVRVPPGFAIDSLPTALDDLNEQPLIIGFVPTEARAYDEVLVLLVEGAPAIEIALRGVGTIDDVDGDTESYYGCSDAGGGGAALAPVLLVGLGLLVRRRRHALDRAA
jgi:uncharacterized protein (TIGR03382 family)